MEFALNFQPNNYRRVIDKRFKRITEEKMA